MYYFEDYTGIFSQFENACLSATLTSYGCVPTLNKEACLNQLTDGENTEATCINIKNIKVFSGTNVQWLKSNTLSI